MRRTRTYATALALLLGFAMAGCGAGTGAGGGGTQPGSKTCADIDLANPPSEPTKIRIGHGYAAEEPFWLMAVDDGLAPNKGRWYTMELSPFRGTGDRLKAYQAGELDAVIVSPQAQIRGTARGALDLYTVATIMREAESDAFSTTFIALERSGINSVEDLKGKKIAVVDLGSQLDFLARQGVKMGGYNPETDVKYVVLPFPSQEQALRNGQIDVAGVPEPFYTLAHMHGGVVDVFNAADTTDFAYDLLTMSFDRAFVEDHLGAVCAWVKDFGKAMAYWKQHKKDARLKLVGTDFVQLPKDTYLKTGDYARPDKGAVDVQGMKKMMDLMIERGILEEEDRVDVTKLIRPGVTIGH